MRTAARIIPATSRVIIQNKQQFEDLAMRFLSLPSTTIIVAVV
jgi:hypothetical protein